MYLWPPVLHKREVISSHFQPKKVNNPYQKHLQEKTQEALIYFLVKFGMNWVARAEVKAFQNMDQNLGPLFDRFLMEKNGYMKIDENSPYFIAVKSLES